MSIHRYRAYGLQIESEVAIPGLAGGDGDADVVIRVGQVEQSGAPARTPQYDGSLEEGRLSWDGVGSAQIRCGREIVVAPNDDVRATGAFLGGPALGVLLTQRGLVPLHASAVALGDGAVAFAGRPRASKSTLAAALHARGHALVSDDILAVSVEDGAFTCRPGTSGEALAGVGPGLGDDPERLDRVRDDLDKRFRPTPNGFSSERLPLRLIYLLGDGDEAAVEEVRPVDAVIELLLNSWTPRSLLSTDPGRVSIATPASWPPCRSGGCCGRTPLARCATSLSSSRRIRRGQAVITVSSTVVAGPGQVSSNVEGEADILELGRGTYYGLDAVGARVWSLIQEPRSVASLRDALVEEYDVDPTRCEADVLALLAELEETGLVAVVE